MENFIYYGQRVLIVCLISTMIYYFLKIRKDSSVVVNRLSKTKVISDLQISRIVNRNFIIDRGSGNTLIKMNVEKGFIYLYFSSNHPVVYSDGPYIICNKNSDTSDFWMKYYIKKLERNVNGEMKLIFSTEKNILFSKYSITVRYISEEDFQLIQDNIL